MNEEIWKDIKGYEGIYQVSNLGNIKNVIKDKIRKPCINPNGYKMVNLYKNGVSKNLLVNRLVAEAFIPNPNNYPVVKHINRYIY